MTWNCTIPKGLIAFATRRLQKKCILRNGFVFFLFNSETQTRGLIPIIMMSLILPRFLVRCQNDQIKTLSECKKQTILQFWQHITAAIFPHTGHWWPTLMCVLKVVIISAWVIAKTPTLKRSLKSRQCCNSGNTCCHFPLHWPTPMFLKV